MMDGTPIYDIKPYIRFSDCHEDAVSGFSDNVLEHSLKVEYDDEMLSIFTDAQRDELIGCLQQDPRPSYQDDGKEYGMSFAGHNVRFMVMDGILKISDVE